jgi:hypothetical protein
MNAISHDGFGRSVAPRQTGHGWRHHLGRAVADTSYVALRLSGWLMMTALATLGVLVLFFMMIGDFTPIGFFSHVANLGTRFVAADQARRAAFGDQLFVVWLVAFGIVAVTRVRLLGAIITSTKGPRHG